MKKAVRRAAVKKAVRKGRGEKGREEVGRGEEGRKRKKLGLGNASQHPRTCRKPDRLTYLTDQLIGRGRRRCRPRPISTFVIDAGIRGGPAVGARPLVESKMKNRRKSRAA